VHAAAGNAARNGLAPTLVVGDATDPAFRLPTADVVVANIALCPILRLAERWRAAPQDGAARAHGGPYRRAAERPPAELVLSGLLVEQAEEALAAFPAYVERARMDDGTWLTLRLSRAS